MASLLTRKDTNMTEGSITRHLVSFAMPLMVGNIFQLLYNTVDSIVVGNFVGKEALAAVGSVSSIINMLIGFFLGLSTGAGVIISQYYGAHDDKHVHDAVHTTIVLTLILCVLFTLIGVLMVPFMLRLMSTPDDVFEGAAQYLRIYFYGISGLMVYNMGSGILQAVGDSRRPLCFLIFSALVNTVLDLVFVIYFHMGIAGVAIATIIAQFLSAGLVLFVLTRSVGAYHIVWSRLRLDGKMLLTILRIGLPSALQQSITSFSNVFVQSYINKFGSACMAGWASYNKIDQFEILPVQTLALATTTFVGQNLGANNIQRARDGASRAIKLALAITAVVIIPIMIFAGPMISLFNQEPGVLDYGILFIRMISPFYLVCCVNMIYSGALRGAGDVNTPMAIMVLSFVVFRQIYLYVTSVLIGTLMPVVFGYPVGWVLCSALLAVYYKHSDWEKKRLAGRTQSPEDFIPGDPARAAGAGLKTHT